MYTGRFAPSPTGPLHFGSLIAAVASYLEARTQQGKWLVRMEDLDQPRSMPGAADAILQALETFGFEWDGVVVYQSQRNEAYAQALALLQAKNLIYSCACSRREIADSALAGIDGPVYPGTCRDGLATSKQGLAQRIRTEDRIITFNDVIQGCVSQNLASDIGDFVLRRADGYHTYQLAVVVDDAEQGITNVVRGADLLASTPRQIYLQQLLGFTTPTYAHVPIAANLQGKKLSKQTLAQALNPQQAVLQVWQALHFLGQFPPTKLIDANLADLWTWAKLHWDIRHVTRQRILPGDFNACATKSAC